LEFGEKIILSSQNKIMIYLRTRYGKIIHCQRLIIHAIKIVLCGTTSMMLNEIIDLIGAERHILKETKSINISLNALEKCINVFVE